MKATIEIDATPQEMRLLLGLPDVEPLQREMMEKLRRKMLENLDTNDPVALMKMLMPMPEQFKTLESLQNTFWQALMKSVDVSSDSEEKTTNSKPSSGKKP